MRTLQIEGRKNTRTGQVGDRRPSAHVVFKEARAGYIYLGIYLHIRQLDI